MNLLKTIFKTVLHTGFIVLLVFGAARSSAQHKTLKEVRVRRHKQDHQDLQDERLKSFASGMKILSIDSQVLAQYKLQSLSQLLNQQVPVFIKSYGINSLATLNFRGSSSAQSQVLWNGIPLNNASLGIADVSMLGVGNFDQISIAFGGSSALLGSGNVGASILLDTKFEQQSNKQQWHTNIATEAGSYGSYKLSLQERYIAKRWYLSAKLFGQKATNNFSFINQNGVTEKMSHAQLKSYSMLVDIGYLLSKNTQIKFSAWQQQFSRSIPAALFEKFSAKQQNDAALRLSATIEKVTSNGGKLYSKSGFCRDQMNYQDTSVKINSSNSTFQWYQEFGWKVHFNKQHELLLFLPINTSWTKPQNDSTYRYQNKIGIAAAYHFSAWREQLNWSINARLERINSKTIALSGTSISYALLPFLTLRANVQRSYRAPTLNEWYYLPGGNPNLRPEQGWSQDAGYELRLPLHKNLLLQHDISVFNRNIYDWIIWFGGSIWTPHNIAQVHSRGVESYNELTWHKGKWQTHIGLNSSFVLATTQQSYIPNDGSIGKQIPYSPRYNGQAKFRIQYLSLNLSYIHSYTGYRFITTDESQYISPYQTGNLFLSFEKKIQNCPFKIQFQCNNIWNTQYQVINLRPMPGRNCSLGLSCQL